MSYLPYFLITMVGPLSRSHDGDGVGEDLVTHKLPTQCDEPGNDREKYRITHFIFWFLVQ